MTNLNTKYRVMIVDDYPLFCTALESWIAEFDYLEHIASFNSSQQLLEALPLSQPDVLLMDIEMKELDGIEATKRVIALYPQIRIIGISIHCDGRLVKRMFDAGALGYLTKDINREIFENAMQSVLNGSKFVTPQAAVGFTLDALKETNGYPSLESFSEQEIRVIKLIASGLSDKEIGSELNISVRTVHAHKRNITDKLGKQKVTEIVAFAFRSGLLNS